MLGLSPHENGGWFSEPGKLWHTREVWERLHHHERRFLSNGQAFNAKVWYVVCSGMITVTPRMGKQMETKSRSMCKVYQNAAWSWGLCGSCTIFWGKILQLPNQQSYTTNLAAFKVGFYLKQWVIQAAHGLSMICTGEVAEAIPTFSNLVGDVRITLANYAEKMAKRNNLFLFQYCFFF